uniref:PAP-associated domain-containing protein n=1 Tax=Enterobius vermicularis TaxID=51028 RepID=A0A0N4V7Z6_ENTVE
LERLCQVRLNCCLEIFGSTKNGFGTKNSDVDLCLHLDPLSLVTQHVGYFLSSNSYLTICNEVAIQNTNLLQSYGRLDRRVPQLGVALKVWTKCCNISGASEGWLSSYAYIIMLLHFLQRLERPVLPFLQQVVEFIWLAPNSQSVAELWLEFFAYYAWKFDYVNEVVQIRHPKVLVKKRKGWDSSPFAVEDPFVLNHNLAATVDSDGNLSVPLFKFFSFSLPGFYKVC